MIARITKDGNKTQSIKSHTDNVCDMCKKYGERIGMKSFAYCAGLLHDMGKYQKAFQDYIKRAAENEEHSKKTTVDHAAIGAKYIYDLFHNGNDYEKITSEIIAIIVAYHHGGLNDFLDINLNIPLLERLNKSEISEGLHEVTDIFSKEIINVNKLKVTFLSAVSELKDKLILFRNKGIDLSFGLTMITKYIYSCLIDSDRSDAASVGNSSTYIENEVVGWDLLLDELEKYTDNLNLNSKANTLILKLRKEISDQCFAFALNIGGIYTLSVPTGGGKTLSSLRYALAHANEFNKYKKRIFYIIPYTTIIEQNASEIRKALSNKTYILEHHSNVLIEEKFEKNIHLSENWDNQIILTSMVQFLNSIYSSSTQDSRRMHNLSNSIIIFDEIQTVPVKCINLLNGALNFLANVCNATIILCTATQPSLDKTKRPLLKAASSEIIKNHNELYEAFRRVNVIDKTINGYRFSCSEVAEFAFNQLKNNNSILIILNTKKTVEKVYYKLKELCKEKVHLIYLSTYMCPAHRTKSIDDLKKLLNNKEKVICISTQLIEAGIDISAECVIRSLAGLDSIAQAAGRCNRHGESNACNVYIVRIDGSEENLDRLVDIRDAQDAAINVLNDYAKRPEKYNNNLLSPVAIQSYYDFYYYEKSGMMDFNIEKYSTSIYKLLSSNKQYNNYYISKYGNSYKLKMAQAIRTAGEEFYVIDKNTITVIVPFEKGADIISELCGRKSSDFDLKKILREAQQYSVSLYSNDISELGNGIFHIGDIAYALNSDFYDLTIGVVKKGGNMCFCNA